MENINFGEIFDKFLESKKYDEVEEKIYQLVRSAFVAGWNAAGGKHISLEEDRK